MGGIWVVLEGGDVCQAVSSLQMMDMPQTLGKYYTDVWSTTGIKKPRGNNGEGKNMRKSKLLAPPSILPTFLQYSVCYRLHFTANYSTPTTALTPLLDDMACGMRRYLADLMSWALRTHVHGECGEMALCTNNLLPSECIWQNTSLEFLLKIS